MCLYCGDRSHDAGQDAYGSYGETAAQYRVTGGFDASGAGGVSTYYVDALNSGRTWAQNGTETVRLTYTFDSLKGHYSDGEAANYGIFNAAQQAATQAALQHFSDVANVTFARVADNSGAQASITFRQADMPSGTAGWAYYPNAYWGGSDVTISRAYDTAPELAAGGFGYRLTLHELGHAMGLRHTHDGGLTGAEDSSNASVMSYQSSSASSIGGAIATRGGVTAPHTLMIYDIAALQYMYGANHAYRSGNDIYQLTGETKVMTLWDGGGGDTLDASSYTGNATLDLREGLDKVSHVGGTYVWNAFGANIENALSGGGNDLLYGNALANSLISGGGNDTLDGGEGADFLQGNQGSDWLGGGDGGDQMQGGKDADTLYGGNGNDEMNGNIGNDAVYGDDGDDSLYGGQNEDLLSGGAGNDTLRGDKGNDTLLGGAGADIFMSGADAGADIVQDFELDLDRIMLAGVGLDAGNVMSAVSYYSGNAVIQSGAGSSITLLNVAAGALDAGDFLFG